MNYRRLSNQRLIEAALADVNKARKVCGLHPLDEMPHGWPLNSLFCPVAQALGGALVAPGVAQFDDDEVAERVAAAWGTETFPGDSAFLTPALEEFVKRFDYELISELILVTAPLAPTPEERAEERAEPF